MTKLKTFFATLFRSATDPEYYREVIRAKPNFSLKYFIFFYLLLAIISTVTIYYTTLRQAPQYLSELLQSTADLYPAELEVTLDTVTSEISTTGVPEPIIIPLPAVSNSSSDVKNLLVIDTGANSEQITAYQTAILLTKTHLATVSDTNSGFQIFPLSEFTRSLKSDEAGYAITSLTLNKNLIDSNLPMIKQFAAKLLNLLPLIMAPVLFIGYFVGRIVFVAFMSLLTTLMAGILRRGLKYGRLFQIGLHTVTVTETITQLSQLVFRNPVNSLFGYAFLGITFIALLGIPKTQRQLI